MPFLSTGYDGTINERQWAELIPSVGSSTYGVKDAEDLKVTAVAGQPLMVSVSSGVAWGHGVMDTATINHTLTCGTISAGTRWDLIALRRDWQPTAGGPSALVVVPGSASKIIPLTRKQTPGVQDDQPLALVQWTAGQTQPTAIVDLRCWSGNGGVAARDILALTYLGTPGASVNIDGTEWNCTVSANDTVSWIKTSQMDTLPLFGTVNTLDGGVPNLGTGFLIQAGSVVQTTDPSGYGRVTFPKPFPNGLVTVITTNGDSSIDRQRGVSYTFPVAGTPFDPGKKNTFAYAMQYNLARNQGNALHRMNWIAIGW